ncbi:hypothetical protein EXIGLDRAFT_726965 [Exidia glandulosa HHB12029]|uniref:Uncharacterized protein n=1 Tax=Exidia glandulosa HHB12029 TaxID=1314781 RepID=A0A165DIE3_EXIGL|nr:hypothetical protein EXIGLDRAFT_726965 [Exidia glandulosa HHB12029]
MTDSGPTPDYLEQYRVPCVPEVYYILDFINHRARGGIPASWNNQERRARVPESSRVGLIADAQHSTLQVPTR